MLLIKFGRRQGPINRRRLWLGTSPVHSLVFLHSKDVYIALVRTIPTVLSGSEEQDTEDCTQGCVPSWPHERLGLDDCTRPAWSHCLQLQAPLTIVHQWQWNSLPCLASLSILKNPHKLKSFICMQVSA